MTEHDLSTAAGCVAFVRELKKVIGVVVPDDADCSRQNWLLDQLASAALPPADAQKTIPTETQINAAIVAIQDTQIIQRCKLGQDLRPYAEKIAAAVVQATPPAPPKETE